MKSSVSRFGKAFRASGGSAVKIEIAQAYYRAVVAFNLFTVATHIFSVIGAFAADVITARCV